MSCGERFLMESNFYVTNSHGIQFSCYQIPCALSMGSHHNGGRFSYPPWHPGLNSSGVSFLQCNQNKELKKSMCPSVSLLVPTSSSSCKTQSLHLLCSAKSKKIGLIHYMMFELKTTSLQVKTLFPLRQTSLTNYNYDYYYDK